MNKENIQTNVIKPKLSFFENESEHTILKSEFEVELDRKEAEIEKYMNENDGKGKLDEEKDELYKQAQILWNEYADEMREAKYVFYLNRPQYNFLTDLLLTKMEYDVNTVFLAMELTDTLGKMKQTKDFNGDKDLVGFEVDATEITYIYHLISKHTVKGLGKNSYSFAQVLKRIGDISKVVSYYDNIGKTLSTDIQNWVAGFDPQVTSDAESVEVEQTS